MHRLRWLSSSRADLVAIFEFVARQSGSVAVGLRFTNELRDRCRELSRLPVTVGRPRPELRDDIRSVAYRGYVIFFRYEDDVFEVVNVIHGHRDIDAMFEGDPADLT